MNLRIIGTGSAGNGYILENDQESLLIDCGVNIKQIKHAMNFSFKKLTCCLISHCHLDHSISINELIKLGVEVYALPEVFTQRCSKGSRCNPVYPGMEFKRGGFRIIPFSVVHDVPNLGFLIHHKDCGTTLYLTDTIHSPYTFRNLNNIIIEANYSKEIIDRKMREGANPEFLRNRVIQSHMSLENCIENVLLKNDLSKVNNIVLIHLSDSNSHEADFKRKVTAATGKNVSVASNGMEIPFDKTPF